MLNETFTYGIEIEYTGATNRQVTDAINAAGIGCANEGYNHITRSHWKLVTDATVTRGGMGGELVSPILRGDAGLATLKTVLAAMNSVEGINVNRNCGIHIHVAWPNMTVDQMTDIAIRYAKFEDEIDLFMPLSRRGSRAGGGFCATVKDTNWTRIKSRSNDCPRTMGNLSPRNNKVNLQSYLRHKTIEFRHHSGTTEYTKISNWVKFVLAFVEKTISMAPAPRVAASSRAYANFRTHVENAGGTMSYRGFKWTVITENGYSVAYTIEEMNSFHVGSATGQHSDTWTSAEWALDHDKFNAFLSDNFPSAQEADALFSGMPTGVSDFYVSRKDELA